MVQKPNFALFARIDRGSDRAVRVKGLGFRVLGLGFRVLGFGFSV
jgi:hypothetical protein